MTRIHVRNRQIPALVVALDVNGVIAATAPLTRPEKGCISCANNDPCDNFCD